MERVAKVQEGSAAGEIKFNLMSVGRDRLVGLREIKAAGGGGLPNYELDGMIGEEERMQKAWEEDNRRRRFNYLPLVLGVLERLAKVGKLKDMVANAK